MNFKLNIWHCGVYSSAMLFLVLFMASCRENKEPAVYHSLTTIEFDNSKLVEMDRATPFDLKRYISQFQDSNDHPIIANFLSPKDFYFFNTVSGELTISSLSDSLFKNHVLFQDNLIALFSDNQLIEYCLKDQTVKVVAINIMESNEFPTVPLYHGGITRINDSYHIGFGTTQNRFFIDRFSVYRIGNEVKSKRIMFPDIFFEKHIQYSDIVLGGNQKYYFYTFNTHPEIFKRCFEKDNLLASMTLPSSEMYLKFDTNRIRDMGYLTTYTFQTAFNVRVFVLDDFVVLLTRNPGKKSNPVKPVWINQVLVFDFDLNLLEKIRLDFDIILNLVSTSKNKVFFTYSPKKTIYVLSFFNP